MHITALAEELLPGLGQFLRGVAGRICHRLGGFSLERCDETTASRDLARSILVDRGEFDVELDTAADLLADGGRSLCPQLRDVELEPELDLLKFPDRVPLNSEGLDPLLDDVDLLVNELPELDGSADVVRDTLRLLGDLSVRTARSFCRAVERLLARYQAIAIDLSEVKSLDVVGLAALLQTSERAAASNVALSIRSGPVVQAGVLRAQLIDELPFVTALVDGDYEWDEIAPCSWSPPTAPFTRHVTPGPSFVTLA